MECWLFNCGKNDDYSCHCNFIELKFLFSTKTSVSNPATAAARPEKMQGGGQTHTLLVNHLLNKIRQYAISYWFHHAPTPLLWLPLASLGRKSYPANNTDSYVVYVYNIWHMSEYLKIYKLKLNGVVLLASCSSKAVPRGCMLHPRLGCCCPVHHVHGSGVMISCHHCMVTPIEGCHSAAYGWGLLHFSCIFHFVASMMPPPGSRRAAFDCRSGNRCQVTHGLPLQLLHARWPFATLPGSLAALAKPGPHRRSVILPHIQLEWLMLRC